MGGFDWIPNTSKAIVPNPVMLVTMFLPAGADDVGASLISIYNRTPAGVITQDEIPVYGLGRIAIASRNTTATGRVFDYQYEIKDHLNSVRVRIPRPDIDGKLTFDEAKRWYKYGNGQPLYVDLNKIDIEEHVFEIDFKGIGDIQHIDLFLRGPKDGSVYGNITLVLKSKNTVVAPYADDYNFEMHKWGNPINWPRNFNTDVGRLVHGKGKTFSIYFKGEAKISPPKAIERGLEKGMGF